jgi:hypothetical protein
MRLEEINTASLRQPGPATGSGAEPDNATPSTESRALVPLGAVTGSPERHADHRYTPFVAHLLAVKAQHPQTRERRRAEPNEVLAAYRATAALTQPH